MLLRGILGFFKVFQRIVEDVLVAVTATSEAAKEGASLDEALELGFNDVQNGIVTILEIDVLLVSLALDFEYNLAKVASFVW